MLFIKPTGRVVILDSGFCVLQGLVQLKKVGVFASAAIKKRRYWPKHAPGDNMDMHMIQADIGVCDSLPGQLDGVDYDLFMMKYVMFVMKLMSTYGGLVQLEDAEVKRRHTSDGAKTFKHTEPFDNHCRCRHAVDDHNNLRHSGISFEETWKTHTWEYRVFTFILAIVEVNAFLAFRHFIWKPNVKTGPKKALTMLQFRRQLAKQMLFNDFIEEEDGEKKPRAKRHKSFLHDYQLAPPHATRFEGGKWICESKQATQQHVCRWPGCTERVRRYCVCVPGKWLCIRHFTKHVADEAAEQFQKGAMFS